MENEKSDFLSAGDPIIIVKKMTKEVVEKAIQAYAEDDGYYLKFYSVELDTKILDVLKNRSIARDKFLDHLIEKGESIDDIENYDRIDFNITLLQEMLDLLQSHKFTKKYLILLKIFNLL